MSIPNPAARSIVLIAVLGGAALFALTLLWLLEVVGLPVFLGGVIVIAVAEGLAFFRVIRRMRQSGDPVPDVGFDPMDGLPGARGRRQDR